MTKQIILIFAVLCSVQVQANSRYTERDTVLEKTVKLTPKKRRKLTP